MAIKHALQRYFREFGRSFLLTAPNVTPDYPSHLRLVVLSLLDPFYN